MQFWAQVAPLAAGGVLALVADAAGTRRVAVWVAAVGALAAGLAGCYGGWTLDATSRFGTFFVGAAFSTVPGVIGILTCLVLIGASEVLALKRHGGALAALLAFAALAAGLTATAIDFIALLLAIETAALASYAFVSAARHRFGDEASMKYYIQGAVSTGLLVLGVAVVVALYAKDGSYLGLVSALSGLTPDEAGPALLGVTVLTTALAFKAGAAPFHSWAPDAYEHAPAETAAFMAGSLKLAYLFAGMVLVVVTVPAGRSPEAILGVLGGDVLPIVGILGVLSVIVGSLAALRQRSYRRMLGYAGVAQVGYGLIATAAVSPLAVGSFGTTYAIAVTGAFLAAIVFADAVPGWDGTVERLAGLGRRMPVLGVAVTLLMVSLAGLPPLVGFWGKFEVFVAAIGAAQQFPLAGSARLGTLYGAFAAIGLAGSVVSLAYYGRVVRVLFAEEPRSADPVAIGEGSGPVGPSRTALAVVVLIALICLVLGVLPLIMGLSAPMDGFLLS